MLTLVLNVLSTKAMQEIMLPAMHTARHPYLLARADTTGPEITKKKAQIRNLVSSSFF